MSEISESDATLQLISTVPVFILQLSFNFSDCVVNNGLKLRVPRMHLKLDGSLIPYGRPYQITSYKFNTDLWRLNKKPLKYFKPGPRNKLKPTSLAFPYLQKNHYQGYQVPKVYGVPVGYYVFQQPVYFSGEAIGHDDVKPIKEHIEGDIKYDFRTKTHYID